MAGPFTTNDLTAYLRNLERFGVKLGLENITRLCEALGHPEHAYRSIIVAGTNGKGSVTAMLDTALRAAGYRTGRYTSPHLQRLEERFVIDGKPAPSPVLHEEIATVRATIDALCARGSLREHPTFFEVTTAVAFQLFRRFGVEVAVLEVGLGGRFDATNVVTPVAAAITSIDLDHQRQLGSTIGAIAMEKAGVVKPGIVVVVADTKAEVSDTFETVCRDRGARLVSATEDVDARVRLNDGRTELSLSTKAHAYGTITLALRGRHQADNAVLAVRLLEELSVAGMPVPASATIAGLSEVTWRGRLELLAWATDRQLLADAAHNPAGVRALASYIHEVYPGGLPIVFGAMCDKDVDGMIAALASCATRFICTAVASDRAMAPAALADRARRIAPRTPVDVQPDVRAALDLAWADTVVTCVTGSIFLVGDVFGALDGTETMQCA